MPWPHVFSHASQLHHAVPLLHYLGDLHPLHLYLVRRGERGGGEKRRRRRGRRRRRRRWWRARRRLRMRRMQNEKKRS